MSLIGSLEDLSFPDILQIIHLSRQTGTLVLRDRHGERRVRFHAGLVCGATLGDGGPELEELLVRKGLVAPAALERGRVRREQSGESLASALVALGGVSQQTIERVVREEICSTIRHLVLLQEGEFRFDLDPATESGASEVELEEGLAPGSLLQGHSGTQPFAAVESWNATPTESRAGAEDRGRPIRVADPISLLRGLICEMQTGGEDGIPLLILRLAAEHFERGILFAVEGRNALCTGAFGPDETDDVAGGLENRIRGTSLPLDPGATLEHVVRTRQAVIGPLEAIPSNQPLAETLGAPIARESAILPLASGREVIGVLYGDNAVSDRPVGDLNGLEIFLSQAGMALQNALLKRRIATLTAENHSGEEEPTSVTG